MEREEELQLARDGLLDSLLSMVIVVGQLRTEALEQKVAKEQAETETAGMRKRLDEAAREWREAEAREQELRERLGELRKRPELAEWENLKRTSERLEQLLRERPTLEAYERVRKELAEEKDARSEDMKHFSRAQAPRLKYLDELQKNCQELGFSPDGLLVEYKKIMRAGKSKKKGKWKKNKGKTTVHKALTKAKADGE